MSRHGFTESAMSPVQLAALPAQPIPTELDQAADAFVAQHSHVFEHARLELPTDSYRRLNRYVTAGQTLEAGSVGMAPPTLQHIAETFGLAALLGTAGKLPFQAALATNGRPVTVSLTLERPTPNAFLAFLPPGTIHLQHDHPPVEGITRTMDKPAATVALVGPPPEPLTHRQLEDEPDHSILRTATHIAHSQIALHSLRVGVGRVRHTSPAVLEPFEGVIKNGIVNLAYALDTGMDYRDYHNEVATYNQAVGTELLTIGNWLNRLHLRVPNVQFDEETYNALVAGKIPHATPALIPVPLP